MKTFKLIFAAFLMCVTIISCSTAKQSSDFNIDYKLEKVVFDVKDNRVKQLLERQKNKTEFKKGQSLKKSTFTKERSRIVKLIRENHNSNFSVNKIRFEIDTTLADNKFSVVAIVQE
ncbi:hypothetical protein [Psychroflexus lacisalsi]|jgi:hypothetical protein|uniref:Lipoprotein n=1 Tax=Psychroflexus lacisalsi TaxID=503928 RepID=A0ABP3VLL8_9FLAO|nr:hypothetical protein [Psychroflexus lacisalsi]MBZ9620228.1 hypothetical protein [Psychroflexus lacisalsi]